MTTLKNTTFSIVPLRRVVLFCPKVRWGSFGRLASWRMKEESWWKDVEQIQLEDKSQLLHTSNDVIEPPRHILTNTYHTR